VWQLPLQNRPIKAQLRGTVRAVESERFKLETFVSKQQQHEGSAAAELVWVPITAEWVPTFQDWQRDGINRHKGTNQRMPEGGDRLAYLPHTAADFEQVCVARRLPGKGNQLWFVFYACEDGRSMWAVPCTLGKAGLSARWTDLRSANQAMPAPFTAEEQVRAEQLIGRLVRARSEVLAQLSRQKKAAGGVPSATRAAIVAAARGSIAIKCKQGTYLDGHHHML
jgi:hypothetical protein